MDENVYRIRIGVADLKENAMFCSVCRTKAIFVERFLNENAHIHLQMKCDVYGNSIPTPKIPNKLFCSQKSVTIPIIHAAIASVCVKWPIQI